MERGVGAVTAGWGPSGEGSLTVALRETGEELGLTLLPAQLQRLQQQALENRFEDIWLATVTRADCPA